MLNDIPLNVRREVELQDGDVLASTITRLKSARCNRHAAAVLNRWLVAGCGPAAAAKERSAAPIPNEIQEAAHEKRN